MRNRLLLAAGKKLMRRGHLRICIIDDEEAYFNEQMLAVAAAAGYPGIERHYRVDQVLLADLLARPRDIVILDIRGVVDPAIAHDGFGLAARLQKASRSYIVVTSAHKFHLRNSYKSFDYVLDDRLLTGVDFVEELDEIVSDYLSRKVKFYEKLLFRAGFRLAQKSLLPPSA